MQRDRNVAGQICEATGISLSRLTSLTLAVERHGVVATATYRLGHDEAQALADTLRQVPCKVVAPAVDAAPSPVGQALDGATAAMLRNVEAAVMRATRRAAEVAEAWLPEVADEQLVNEDKLCSSHATFKAAGCPREHVAWGPRVLACVECVRELAEGHGLSVAAPAPSGSAGPAPTDAPGRPSAAGDPA